jgi:hypothetical protein
MDRMNRKVVSAIMLTLLTSMLLASFEIGKASASPSVRVYVAKGYKTEIQGNQVLKVMINIESPPEWRNSSNGIVGWSFDVSVDPDILEPMTIESSTDGYFLYDFTVECEHEVEPGFRSSILFVTEKEAGLFKEIGEFIFGWGTLGIGAGGNGVLCGLLYKCETEVSSFQIDIYEACYWTRYGFKHCDVIDDGHYNVQSLPETNNDSFNSTYNDAKPESDLMKGESGITMDLNPFFILTTMVFTATTVYLAIIKPKMRNNPTIRQRNNSHEKTNNACIP